MNNIEKTLFYNVQYTQTHKIFNVFGLKIKIASDECANQIRAQQKKVLEKLQQKVKTQKLKVAFLIVDNQKWNADSLYRLFEKNENFDPYIVVSLLNSIHLGIEKNRQGIQENMGFFHQLGLNVIQGYDPEKKEYVDLAKEEFDIIFYTSPWSDEYSEIQWIENTSKHALLCYIPYAIAEAPSSMKLNKLFFESIFKHFVVDKKILKDYQKVIKNNKSSLMCSGHTKLDKYFEPIINNICTDKPIVIYAPHFTIGKRFFSTGTFDWSGLFMLEYAKQHPEYYWIFKPHPLLRSEFLARGIMTEDEIEQYFSHWAKLGCVYEYGNYIDLFRNSFAMITDSASFLLEYYPTQNPVIRLMSKTYTYNNALTEMIAARYYLAHNQKELMAYLKDVLENKNDPLKDTRLKFLELFQPLKSSAAQNIMKDLCSELNIIEK